jgi:hypothetical protein
MGNVSSLGHGDLPHAESAMKISWAIRSVQRDIRSFTSSGVCDGRKLSRCGTIHQKGEVCCLYPIGDGGSWPWSVRSYLWQRYCLRSEADRRSAELPVTAPKPTSVRTEADRSMAMDEYKSEQQATLDRMANQRRARLSGVRTKPN